MADAFWQTAWIPVGAAGIDTCSLRASAAGWRIEGSLWRDVDGGRLTLTYRVLCDSRWAARAVHLDQEGIGRGRSLQLTSDNFQHWWWGGKVRPKLTGCFEVDLSLTPATNTPPIRRLSLAQGEEREIDVVSVRFPELEIRRVRHSYRRTGVDEYLHRDLESGSKTTLRIDEQGLVVDYPDRWILASPTPSKAGPGEV